MDRGTRPPRSVPHGEYQLDQRGHLTPAERADARSSALGSSANRRLSSPGLRRPLGSGAMTFSGRDALHARRVALGWWYEHRQVHGLIVKEFFARCRQSADGRTISYYAR